MTFQFPYKIVVSVDPSGTPVYPIFFMLLLLLLLLLFTDSFVAHNQGPQLNYLAEVSPHISVYSSCAL